MIQWDTELTETNKIPGSDNFSWRPKKGHVTPAADKKRIQNKALLERFAALGGDSDEKEINFHVPWM